MNGASAARDHRGELVHERRAAVTNAGAEQLRQVRAIGPYIMSCPIMAVTSAIATSAGPRWISPKNGNAHDEREHRARQVDRAPPDAIRDSADQNGMATRPTTEAERSRRQHRRAGVAAASSRRSPGRTPCRRRTKHVLGEAHAHPDQQLPRVLAEHVAQRRRVTPRPPALSRANAGVSSTRRRTNSPTAISTTRDRNGTRQPHARNVALGQRADSSANTPVDSSSPAGTPICGQRRGARAVRRPECSTAISTAPPHSPPTPKPWTNRSSTSRIGAQTPIEA